MAKGAIEYVTRHLDGGRVLGLAATVDENIQPARRCHRPVDQGVEIRVILQVGDYRVGHPPVRLYEGDGLRERARVLSRRFEGTGADHHRRALRRESLRQGATDPATGARHERHLAR